MMAVKVAAVALMKEVNKRKAGSKKGKFVPVPKVFHNTLFLTMTRAKVLGSTYTENTGGRLYLSRNE